MFNSLDGRDFPSFSPIFYEKMATILNFENFFQFFFQKAQLDPGRVIVWKFEGRRSSGLVATRGTHIHTYADTHKVNNRTNLFSAIVIFTLIFELLLAVSNKNCHITKNRESISFCWLNWYQRSTVSKNNNQTRKAPILRSFLFLRQNRK